jgi:SH3 domain protein
MKLAAMKFRLLALCLLALAAAAADAQTLYVSDRLEITLRTGTTTQHSIVRMLPSGTPVTVLEVDSAAGYTRVRTREGAEGWVLTRYLMDRPAAREQLAALSERADALGEIMEERDALLAERDGLGAELEDVRAELERIRRLSAAAVELDTVNRELRTRLAAVEQAGDGLRAEIAELKRNTQRDWFLAGAGVLVLGIVLGIVVPRLRVRRRSRWGDLH